MNQLFLPESVRVWSSVPIEHHVTANGPDISLSITGLKLAIEKCDSAYHSSCIIGVEVPICPSLVGRTAAITHSIIFARDQSARSRCALTGDFNGRAYLREFSYEPPGTLDIMTNIEEARLVSPLGYEVGTTAPSISLTLCVALSRLSTDDFIRCEIQTIDLRVELFPVSDNSNQELAASHA